MDYSGYQKRASKSQGVRFLTVEYIIEVFDAVAFRNAVSMPVEQNVLSDQVRDELRSKGIGHYIVKKELWFFKMVSVEDMVHTFACLDGETQDELLEKLYQVIEHTPEWLIDE